MGRCWGRKSSTNGSGEDGGLSEFPALVTGQSSTESHTIVTQTPDPTSVEFEFVFRDLLGEALKPTNRKLLLVLDNLDRVQPSDALSIWSTLQTFLGNSDYRRAHWIDRLWVLIPYDGKAILRLWDRSGSDPTAPTNSALAASFLDKTFQLRFRVPSLLLSNWRGFLQEALQRALPDHQEADFHDVYRAFATKGGLETSAPTPRDLKIFVNQIGALHREWQDAFPLSHLACYVLLQKDGANVRKILHSNEDQNFLTRNIGTQWREIIAALHFGVPVQEARQLLLRRPIEVVLASGDGKGLAELASIHPAAFWPVLEDSVPAGAQDWNSLTPVDLAKAATALAMSSLLDHPDSRPEEAAIRSSIRTAAAAIRAWTPFDAATAKGMVAVGRLTGKSEEIIPALLAGASNARVEAPEGEEQDEDSKDDKERVSPSVWMASALMVVEGLVDLDLGNQMEKGITVPLSAQQWFDVSSELAEKDPDGRLLRYFDIEAIREVDQLLAQQVIPDQIDGDIVDAVHTTMATRSRNAMKDTANTVFSHLESDEVIQADQLAFMLRTLRLSRVAGLISKEQYGEFAANGHYLHHLHQAVSDNHAEVIAACMFGFLEFVPDASEPPEVGNSSAGYENLTTILEDPDTVDEVVEHFIADVIDAQQLSIVFGMAAGQQPVPPLLSRAIRFVLLSRDVPKPLELVRERWSLVRDVLETEKENTQSFETFLKEWPDLDNLTARVVDGTFYVNEGGLYAALVKSNASTDIITWCVDGLASVDRAAWAKDIESERDLVELVIELKTRNANIALGVPYFDALIEYARNVAIGLERVLPDESWHELFALLNADHQKLFLRRVYGVFETLEGDASTKFFDLFGGMLSTHDLANEPRLIEHVCWPILTKRNVRGLAWVADVAETHPALLTEHSDQIASSDFRSRVRMRLNDTPEDDPTLPDLKRIGAVLGIESGGREDSDAESEARFENTRKASE